MIDVKNIKFVPITFILKKLNDKCDSLNQIFDFFKGKCDLINHVTVNIQSI